MKKLSKRLLCFLSIVFFIPGPRTFAQNPPSDLLEELKLFSKALGAIVEGYVGDVQPRKLYYEAVRGMAKSLDPYSEFIDPEKYELMKIGIKGEYAGIGTWIKESEGFILIEKIREGSAAEVAGLKVNDKILAVDGVMTQGKNVAEVGSMLRGEPNTNVKITIRRDAEEKIFEVTIMRETFQIEAVRDIRIVGKAIGYMQITDFQEKTTEQAEKGLEDLSKKGMKAIIIDLRNNPGGLLKQAVALASLFLDKGEKVVSVNSKIDAQKQEYSTEGAKHLYKEPMVILVNQYSASASEVFSACMQDHKRATIVGVKTYGKASVQSLIPLDDVSALKLTTARYLSPNGQHIDGVGIQPNVIVQDGAPGTEDAQNQIKAALKILKEYYE